MSQLRETFLEAVKTQQDVREAVRAAIHEYGSASAGLLPSSAARQRAWGHAIDALDAYRDAVTARVHAEMAFRAESKA